MYGTRVARHATCWLDLHLPSDKLCQATCCEARRVRPRQALSAHLSRDVKTCIERQAIEMAGAQGARLVWDLQGC